MDGPSGRVLSPEPVLDPARLHPMSSTKSLPSALFSSGSHPPEPWKCPVSRKMAELRTDPWEEVVKRETTERPERGSRRCVQYWRNWPRVPGCMLMGVEHRAQPYKEGALSPCRAGPRLEGQVSLNGKSSELWGDNRDGSTFRDTSPLAWFFPSSLETIDSSDF